MPDLAIVTNVKHYLHQIEAARSLGIDTSLCAPWYPGPALHDRLLKLGGPVGQLAQRRGLQPVGVTTKAGLGPGQFVPPVLGRLGMKYSAAMVRHVHRLERMASRRVVVRAQTIHAVEGLVPHSIPDRGASVIMERRNLHHEVFEVKMPGRLGFPLPMNKRDPLREIYAYEYERANIIQVYSAAARDSFLERGFDPGKLAVVPIPFEVNPAEGMTSRDRPTALYVGRCVVEKGLDLVVEATLASSEVDHLLVAGAATPEVVSWLHNFPHVKYLGILPKPKIRKLMAESAVLMMPSIESYGLAVLEAIDLSLPVLVSATTGVSEFLAQEDPDSVIDGRDLDTWVGVLNRFVSEAEIDRTARLARQRRVLGHVTWDIAVQRQAHVYERLGLGGSKETRAGRW